MEQKRKTQFRSGFPQCVVPRFTPLALDDMVTCGKAHQDMLYEDELLSKLLNNDPTCLDKDKQEMHNRFRRTFGPMAEPTSCC